MMHLDLLAAATNGHIEAMSLMKIAISGLTAAVVTLFTAGLWFAKSLWTKQEEQRQEYEDYVKSDGRAVVKALTETNRLEEKTTETIDRVCAKMDSWQRHEAERQKAHEEMIRRCEEQRSRNPVIVAPAPKEG